MKKITLALMLLVTFSGFAQFPAPYCGPMTFTSNVEPITLVNFAGINQTSSATVGANNGTTIIAHEDYTAIVGNVSAGTTYPITLKGNTDGNFTTRLRVYIDWNQNNVFTDAGESYDIGNIVNSTGVDAIELVGNITVPGTALGGNTRMRVIKRYNAFGTSCQTGAGYGQAEDYTLSVTALAPCLTGFEYPSNVTVPGLCDGVTPTIVATDSWAGDYFTVTVTSGEVYRFLSSVATDYLTVSTDSGTTAVTSGTTPLSWVSTVTGDIRVYINTDSACGTEDVDRETSVICGTPCLTGTLYPAATYDVPVCDGTTVNVVATDSWAGEYSNINVFDTNDYVFSSSVATDYLTVASADGLTVLAVGIGSVSYAPNADGVVRVYFHTNSTCGTQNTNRERRIVCTTALTVPECASNPTPADGSTTVPAFATFDISWDAPTTGEPATSYDLYSGTDSGNLVFEGNIAATSITGVGPIGAYSTTIYWQIIPRNAAGAATGCTIWSFTTEPQPTDTPDWANLQFPAAETITQGGSITVYGQVYEGGLTDVVPNIDGQAPGILAWVGTGATGTDPSTWTDWTVATWNSGHISNNDEYQASIGATLAPGTYDYATRFSLNDGPYVYGGLNNGFWDGTTHPSGVLTVEALPAPANDNFATPTAVSCGNTYTGDTTSATLDEDNAPDGFTADLDAPNVWYSFTGSGTPQTVTVNLCGSSYDTSVLVYTGTSGSLTLVAGNDDDSTCVSDTLNSRVSFDSDGTTTYYITVEGWNVGSVGAFTMDITCASPPQPPVNDDCSDAVTVTCGSTTAGTTALATNENMPVCGISGVTTQNTPGVWYKYVGDGSDVTVTTCSPTITTGDSRIAVYSGTCGALTCIGGNDDAQAAGCATNTLASVVTFSTVAGTDYYILVYSYTFTPGTNPINFELSVSCVAACTPATTNDECSTATQVTIGTPITGANNSCSSASLGTAYPSCGNMFGTYYDTWYWFDSGSVTDVTITLANQTGAAGFALYSGTCGALTQVNGSCTTTGAATSLTGLSIGTYYLRVFSTSPASRGSYDLSITDDGLGNGSFDSSSFTYYPNPVKNILNLSYNQEISNVEVYNLLGQKVSSTIINANDAHIDMSNLPNGAYMVRVTSNDQVKTIKVIKE
ncbi:T9SS type A sorting domain-containing protein [Flavobacterium sp. AS60]|uniref:T9SS type A sorting domain-containing protein n=1 Tax=Flavobacterium anseongense TaxID=2910677 RepID=UPI001F1A2FAE|nr:T9SS type A sorting domain-containing protein [Flavobacterium sp. AS60]MCF6128700.1 T9SS type A sorting domain-containing protein [Flavobacterium sp. AS60]